MSDALNFKWLGDEVECRDANLRKRSRTFYRCCALNGQRYDVGDYAIAERGDRHKRREICRILWMYESRRETHRFCASVRWYTWARNVKLPPFSFTDATNEVVEDLTRAEETIGCERLTRKCHVFFTMPDDPDCSHLKFGDSYFPCRYKMTDPDGLVPIISESMSPTLLEEIERAHLTPHSKKSKRKTSGETIVILRDDDSTTTTTTPSENASPLGNLRSTSRFKRNLNESFGSSPKGAALLNYSLIDQSDDENEAIKLKLRVSSRCSKSGHHRPTPLDRTPSTRKSNRTVKRVSYAENISPVKRSPSKGGGRRSTTGESVKKQLRNTRRSKVDSKENESSPSKQRSSKVDSKENESSPSKRSSKVVDPKENESSPSKRSSKVDLEENESSPSKRSSKVVDSKENESSLSKRSSKVVDPKENESSPSKRSSKVDLKENESSPSKRSRTKSVSGESASLNELVKVRNYIVEDEGASISKADVDRNVADLFRKKEITSTRRSPRNLTDAVFSDLLKKVVCKVEQLDVQLEDALTPGGKSKKCKKHDCDDGDDGRAKKLRTPRGRVKLLREGLIAPSMQARSTPIKADTTPLNRARARLHVSHVPNALPCRETEFDDIFGFIEGKLSDKCGGCMYVSGVPGTGKTATVTEVIRQLQAMAKTNEIPGFQYVNLNGMKLTEPRQSYVEILKQLTGKTLAWEQAQNALEVKFTKAQKKLEPIVLVVDELDILCTKRQDVVYNLLDWPSRTNMPLIIITIANTMDLPERLLMGRVTSRLGLTRLTFQAYTHKQLQEIVAKRLAGADVFNPDAVQLVARKVASVSGDARRALDICRRAAEMAELEGGDAALVSMSHVNRALDAMITQPKVKAIKRCTRLQQLVLQAVVSEVERTGVEETTFSDVFTMLVSVASLDGFRMVSGTVALRAVSCLGACRLLLLDQKSGGGGFLQKMILNVSPEDVYYALRRD